MHFHFSGLNAHWQRVFIPRKSCWRERCFTVPENWEKRLLRRGRQEQEELSNVVASSWCRTCRLPSRFGFHSLHGSGHCICADANSIKIAGEMDTVCETSTLKVNFKAPSWELCSHSLTVLRGLTGDCGWMSGPTTGKNPPGVHKGSDGNQGPLTDAESQQLCRAYTALKEGGAFLI